MKVSRYLSFWIVLLLTVALAAAAAAGKIAWWWAVAPALLSALGIWDMNQRSHAILRNYPLMGHFRFLFEMIRPEMRQYFFESDNDGAPFTRKERSLVYQRAKGEVDSRPFGTEL
ncbi:MAG TPA: FMN-binding glutamate synthase family protein, partial [Collimonas sp.]|nr:FMN-binding glutamate synthase family protein [Collimonas sp.]